MYGFLLQDWTTICGSGATTVVTQTEERWLSVEDYRDLVFWLEVKDVALGGASAVVIAYETGPTKEEALFASLASFNMSVATTPVVTKIIEGVSSVLPSTWLRWKVRPTSPSGEWKVTFRLHLSANPRRVV